MSNLGDATFSAVSGALGRMLPDGCVVRSAGLNGCRGCAEPEPRFRRKLEFALGRELAARGLKSLRSPVLEVDRGSSNEPLWPEGFRGSISHTRNVCAAVVARESVLASIGIDIEVIADVEPALWAEIATPGEMENLLSESAQVRPGIAAALFSAKEAIYKCQFPLTQQFLEFDDVEVSFDQKGRTFAASSLNHPVSPIGQFQGRFEICGPFVVTASWLVPGASLSLNADMIAT